MLSCSLRSSASKTFRLFGVVLKKVEFLPIIQLPPQNTPDTFFLKCPGCLPLRVTMRLRIDCMACAVPLFLDYLATL